MQRSIAKGQFMKRPARTLGLLVASLLVLLLAVMLGRMALFRSRQPAAEGPASPVLIDEAAAIGRLCRALQFRTISAADPAAVAPAFTGLREHLEKSFPRVHAALQREIVLGHSLLYTWRGSDPTLAPVVLMGHQDVVPVEPGTEGRWTAPPFAGVVRDGYIWGRGTMDDKAGLVSTLEAAEILLAQGVTPRRTVYLSFGHDEEVEGKGAEAIARLVRGRGPAPVLVMDEGMVITEGKVPGVSRPVALLGTAQKGYLSLELSVSTPGGHSSMPPPRGAIGLLAEAVGRLEGRPFPAELSGPANDMFDFAGPEMAFPLRLVMANRWLLAPVVRRLLLAEPATAALLRTTTAVTMFNAGVKDNVLPTSARATVNLRLRPGDSVAAVTERVRGIVGPGVTVQGTGRPVEPSPPSSPSSPRFALVGRSLRRVMPEAVVAPALMLGYADAKHYEAMTADIYRFRPMVLRGDDPSRIHGLDERISVADYLRHIRFYAQVLRDVQDMPAP
jgi:carboxypeptidase PM20D1